MPLPKNVRDSVVQYILRDLAPGRPPAQKPMEYFLSHFDFIDKVTLQKHLAESFYQARFNEKIRGALGLKKDFNNVFIKTQIILYASIYEAVIDYALEKHKSHAEVASLLKQETFSPVSALSAASELTYKDGDTTHKVFTCKKKIRTQQLKEVQFKERLAAAIRIGFVQQKHQQELEALYVSRNKIHILAAAADDFRPDGQQSSKAFQSLFEFLAHAKTYFQASGS